MADSTQNQAAKSTPSAPGRAAPGAQKPKNTATQSDLEAGFGRLVLGRLTYGVTSADLAKFNAGGTTQRARLTAFIEAQLHPESIEDGACEARIKGLGLETLGKSLPALWSDHRLAADQLRERNKDFLSQGPVGNAPIKNLENELRHKPLQQTEIATWVGAVHSQRQLGEMLAEFWHGHFSVYGPDGNTAPVFVHYDRDVIRRHALGNFREFLEAVATSPAMLFYLDNQVNQSGNPNENYARELFELHTLGAENYLGTSDRRDVPGYPQGAPVGYVDGDVYEAARCFTGWRVDNDKNSKNDGVFQYFDGWHDRFQKIVLGQAIAEYQPPMHDGRTVLDRLSAHPGTAHYIAKKLCTRLVADNPPPQLVENVAQVFRAKAKDKDQLRAVVRTIALSDEFALASSGRKFRRPFEFMVAALRGVGAEVAPDEEFLRETGRLGQRLFQWRTPDGYPDRPEPWAGTTGLSERWRFCNLLLSGKLKGATVDVEHQSPVALSSADDIAQYWLRRIAGGEVSAKTQAVVTSFLSQGNSPKARVAKSHRAERLRMAAVLALFSPEFQWRA